MVAPCVVRSRIDWDSRPPRDLRFDELAYLYWIEHSYSGDSYWLHLVSLERGRCYTLMLRAGQKSERWLEVLA